MSFLKGIISDSRSTVFGAEVDKKLSLNITSSADVNPSPGHDVTPGDTHAQKSHYESSTQFGKNADGLNKHFRETAKPLAIKTKETPKQNFPGNDSASTYSPDNIVSQERTSKGDNKQNRIPLSFDDVVIDNSRVNEKYIALGETREATEPANANREPSDFSIPLSEQEGRLVPESTPGGEYAKAKEFAGLLNSPREPVAHAEDISTETKITSHHSVLTGFIKQNQDDTASKLEPDNHNPIVKNNISEVVDTHAGSDLASDVKQVTKPYSGITDSSGPGESNQKTTRKIIPSKLPGMTGPVIENSLSLKDMQAAGTNIKEVKVVYPVLDSKTTETSNQCDSINPEEKQNKTIAPTQFNTEISTLNDAVKQASEANGTQAKEGSATRTITKTNVVHQQTEPRSPSNKDKNQKTHSANQPVRTERSRQVDPPVLPQIVPKAAEVRIGQVDVFIEASAKKQPASRVFQASSHSLSSRHYLKRM